ncbi:MAG: alpha/beta fold hydrolase [Candidatus Eisenbacteria bacterium]|nr:alpha/beta fold hydrolase [Candidatus Eisenbacteria bacterium]
MPQAPQLLRLFRGLRVLRALRALGCIELRQLRRSFRRSSLVALLIAVPVAVLVGVGTLARIAESTPDERAMRAMGNARLRIELASPLGPVDSVLALLPADAVIEEIWEGPERVQFRGRRLRAVGMSFCVRSPLERHAEPARALPGVRLLQGRAPENAGEVALAPILIRGLGCALGDTVSLSFGPARVVTGVVVDPEDLTRPVLLRARAIVEHQGRRALLVSRGGQGEVFGEATTLESPLGCAVGPLRERGYRVQTRAEAAGEPDGLAVVVSAAAAIGFVEAALVIAAAFGVALRRRQYEIGLVGSVGAESWATSSALVASALALALVGGALGLAAGLVGAAALHPHLDGWNHRLNGDFEVSLRLLFSALGLGLVSAGCAAAIPAWRSAHLPVRIALSGRRPVTTSVCGWVAFGGISLAAGLALIAFASSSGLGDAPLDPSHVSPAGRVSDAPGPPAGLGPLALLLGPLALVLGPVLALLGFAALSPWLLERTSRLAGRLPLSWRLAVRDAGRYRGRSGAAITAVLASMSMCMTAAVLVAAIEASIDALPAALRDDQLLIQGPDSERIAAALSRELPILASAPLSCVYAQGEPVRVRAAERADSAGVVPMTSRAPRPARAWIACGGSDLLRALGGSEDGGGHGSESDLGAGLLARPLLHLLVSDRRADVQPIVGWIGTGPEVTSESALQLSVWRSGTALPTPRTRRTRVDQAVVEPRYFLHSAHVAELGFEAGPPPSASVVPWLIRLRVPVSSAALEIARRVAAESPGTTVDAQRLHERPTRTPYRVALVSCLAIGLTVVLIATALSAAESAADRQVVRVVGATPAQVRAHHAARAAYLALLGCALSVPSGFASAHALAHVANFHLPFVMPWRDLWITLLGLPSLGYAIAWLTAPDAGRKGNGRQGGRPGHGTVARGLVVLLTIGLSGLCAVPCRGQVAVPWGGEGVAPCRGQVADAGVQAGTAPAGESPPKEANTIGANRNPPIAWERFVGRAFDGTPLVGELGRLRVPVNRRVPSGDSLEISFVRYRTSNPHPMAPIFFLAGGPGGSGVELSGPHVTHPQLRLLDHADVIGVDQRGVGRSAPDLGIDSVFTELLPFDRAPTRGDEEAAFRRALRRGVDYWQAHGVDVAAYNSAESADDLDAVREALGEARITGIGTSYGTHLALAYLRRHPDRVERLFLSKVEGPDHTWKLPSTTQECLQQLQRRVSTDPNWRVRIPDLIARVRDLLDRLSLHSVAIPLPGSGSIALGPNDLRRAVAERLADARTAAAIPLFLDRCSRGDWTPLAEQAAEYRRIEVPIMPALIDCASDGSETRLARIERERRDPRNILADALAAPFYPSVCDLLDGQDLGDAFRRPFSSDVPILFVSGASDARTPSANVAELAPWFPRSAHVVADHAGHDARELMSEEYREVVQAFLRGEEVPDLRLELPPVPFDPVPLEPAPFDPVPLDPVPLEPAPFEPVPLDPQPFDSVPPTAGTPSGRSSPGP